MSHSRRQVVGLSASLGHEQCKALLVKIWKMTWAEDLTLEIISFKSKYEGVRNGRSKRIE